MPRWVWIFGILGFVVSCSKSTEEIPVTLDFGSITGVTKVLVVAQPANSSTPGLIYPDSCLGSNGCLIQGCGFDAIAEDSFKPFVPFDSFPDGSDIFVKICGTDNSSSPLAAGSGTVINSVNSSLEITMSNANPDLSQCALGISGGLPGLCS